MMGDELSSGGRDQCQNHEQVVIKLLCEAETGIYPGILGSTDQAIPFRSPFNHGIVDICRKMCCSPVVVIEAF